MNTQVTQSTTPATATPDAKPCEACGFEDHLVYKTADGHLPAYLCTFCVTSWPKQYLN